MNRSRALSCPVTERGLSERTRFMGPNRHEAVRRCSTRRVAAPWRAVRLASSPRWGRLYVSHIFSSHGDGNRSMNPYVIILGVFTLAGFAMAVWGWRMLAAARHARRWLSITGTVSAAAPDDDDEPPRIIVGYAIGGRSYHTQVAVQADLVVLDLAARYPVGKEVQLYYDPDHPEQVALRRPQGGDAWLNIAIAVGAALFGLGAMFLRGCRGQVGSARGVHYS